MVQVHVHEAKTRLSKLLELVESGETVVIARNGKSVVEWFRRRSRGIPIRYCEERSNRTSRVPERQFFFIHRSPPLIPCLGIDRARKLTGAARQALSESTVLISIASLWEMILKKSKKGALLADPLPWWTRHVAANGLRILPIMRPHVAIVDSLAEIHKDPFDRIMVAQAIFEKARIVSGNRALSVNDVPVIW